MNLVLHVVTLDVDHIDGLLGDIELTTFLPPHMIDHFQFLLQRFTHQKAEEHDENANAAQEVCQRSTQGIGQVKVLILMVDHEGVENDFYQQQKRGQSQQQGTFDGNIFPAAYFLGKNVIDSPINKCINLQKTSEVNMFNSAASLL